MTNLPNNNQLPPIDNHNSSSGEPLPPREEGEPTLSLTQEAQSVFENAASPFELSQQFQRIKIRSHTIKNNSLNG